MRLQRAVGMVMTLLAVSVTSVGAQPYPQRPVRLVVAVTAGGSTDIIARIIAAKLGERIGQQVVVDNRPGGSRIIGADIVAKAQPDGHTLLMGSGSMGTISSLFAKLPFDQFRDFAPVSLIGTSPYPDLPSLAETGLPGFHAVGWFGVFATGRTPDAVIIRLNSELSAIMKTSEMRERFIGQGSEPLSGPPEDLRKYFASEVSKWGKVIREAGIKAE